MEVLGSILDAVGETPLVRLQRVTRGLRPTVLAKLEMLNPGGSVKDRIGLRMIEAAERSTRSPPFAVGRLRARPREVREVGIVHGDTVVAHALRELEHRVLQLCDVDVAAGPAAANPASVSPVARTTANVERMIAPYAAGRAKPATCS